ncbi:MAG: DUF3943 domain-containing protein, partial [Dysgonamonadaceae bacterium]|nr:DUF3943 domain-containing protein [Dysgonamonadaceae bacterium]
AEDSEIRKELDNGMYLDLRLIYGDTFSEENEKPYSSFSLSTTLNFFSYQPLISNVNVKGQLWGKSIPMKKESSELRVGIFQHFDYYDSNAVFEGQKVNSYRISEAAAFGIGGLFKTSLTSNTTFFTTGYLNAILLGGSITDHFKAIDRDYNMGSGFSSKLNAGFLFRTKAEFSLSVEDYRLFTWKGYDPDLDLSGLTNEELLNLNTQGDEGNAKLTVLSFKFNYRYRKRYTVSSETSYYFRDSRYKYFPDVKYQIVESKIGLGYLF